ncbi:hypothetical protein ACFZDI_10550 [Streptomyces sp. NPDC007907]|uniref:hypothetical protein n=1 Tax=Streptomyces sp. NPDC007907 TaxID=3364789 RepID=UPI0036EB492C
MHTLPGAAPRPRRARRPPLLTVCYAVAALGGLASSDAASTYRSLVERRWLPVPPFSWSYCSTAAFASSAL